jgi:glucokinase
MGDGEAAKGRRVLLADVGGTNVRFSLMHGTETGPIEHRKVADFPTFADALANFLEQHSSGRAVDAAVLDVAGPVENNRCLLTNSGWVIDGAELQKAFGITAVRLINDFEAVAWSLPALEPDDLYAVGEQRGLEGAPMLAFGPGTGFGAACLVFNGELPFAVGTEAGHATLPATSDREELVIRQLRRRFGHVSIERVLSGPGLENLYSALSEIDGGSVPKRDAAQITQAALEESCAISGAALDMFCSLLGAVAGNLALTFCARGGVFIAGGIVPQFAHRLAESDFRKQFENKARYESYLKNIPTRIVIRPDVSFLGLKAFFEKTFRLPLKQTNFDR